MAAREEGAHDPSTDPRADASAPPLRALMRGLDQSSVMSMELLAGILTWMGIGWLLDRWLGTMPWLMVAGALVGNAAGIYLIWIRCSREDGAQPAAQDAAVGDVGEKGRARGED